jgi:hypothetical protein
MRTQHYLAAIAPGSVEETDQGIRVKALAFVEGKQTPVKGRAATKTPQQLQTYAANTNAWIDSGREVPFFESPHDLGADGYSNEKKIGRLEAFTAQPIAESDIPSDKFKDLIGKTGIFTQAEITRDDAIAKYKKGLIKEISVGLGDMGNGPQIFEASAVPWGAVRGAMLFGHPIIAEGEDEDEAPEVFALTMEGAIAERAGRDSAVDYEIERLSDLLTQVIRSIKTAPDSELIGRDRQQLMAQAINDFSTKLRQDLGLTALAPVPVGESFMKVFQYSGKPLATIFEELKAGGEAATAAIAELSQETNLSPEVFTRSLTPGTAAEVETYGLIVGAIAKRMDKGATTNALSPEIEQRFSALQTQVETFAQRAQAAETELAGMKLRQQVGDRYMAIKAQAGRLNAAGKLSAAAYSAYFPADEQFSSAVERFSAAPVEGAEQTATLDEIAATLNYLEKFGSAIQTGSISGQDPIAAKGNSELTAEEKADIERFADKQGLQGAERESYLKKVGAA